MEELYKSGKAKAIGISNIGVHELTGLIEKSEIKPAVVQNSFGGLLHGNFDMLAFCKEHNIDLQCYGISDRIKVYKFLDGEFIVDNVRLEGISEIATAHNVSNEQIMYSFVYHMGITPLTGTTNEEHMKQNLATFDFTLTGDEVDSIRSSIEDTVRPSHNDEL